MKRVPMRMCVVCRKMMPKKDLIRVIMAEDGTIIVDETKKANGRGAYVCKSECIDELKKRKSFERALGGVTNDELYVKLQGIKDNE